MRRVPNRIVVDPPSGDVTRERIERRLFQTLAADDMAASRSVDAGEGLAPNGATTRGLARGSNRKRRMVWAAAIAGTLAVGAVSGLAVFRTGPRGVGTSATGAVASRPGSRVITGPTERSHVSVGDASVEVGADSDVDVRHDAAETLLVLTRGSVDCDVPPRAGRSPFEVAAGAVRVTVIGTRFSVARDTRATRVAVTRGRVAVTVGAETWTVSAGERWERAENGGAATDAASTAEGGTGIASAFADENATPPDTAGAGSPHPREDSLPATEPTIDVPHAAGPTRADAARIAAARTAAGSAARGAQSVPTTSGTRSPEDLFNEALRLERQDPRRAAALYRQLARTHGPWAPIGLFSVAALAHARGHLGETLAAATEYERRFPSGAHRQDIAWLRIDAFIKAGERDEAAAAARDYLARFPSGTYASSAQRLLH